MNGNEAILTAKRARALVWALCAAALAMMLARAWNKALFMDEYSFLRNVAGFVQHRSIVPVYALYPTFYSYLIAAPIYLLWFIVFLAQGLPLAGLHDPSLLKLLFVENVMIWTWAARITTMAFTVALLAVVLRKAAARFRLSGVLVTAGLLILDPFNLLPTGYGLPDVPMVFLVTSGLFLCYRYAEGGPRRFLYWAAFLVGLGASTKLNGVFGAFPVLLAPALGPATERRNWKVYGAAALFVGAGFLAGSPAILFAPQVYLQGFAAERGVLMRGHVGALDRNWIWIPIRFLIADPPLAVLLGLGILGCALRRTKEDILFMALLIPALLVLGPLPKKALWYLAVVYPAAALMVGRLVHDLVSHVRRPALQNTVLAALILVFVVPFGRVFAAARMGVKPDNTETARRWINARVPPGSVILVDWAYVPRLEDVAVWQARIRDARAAASPFTGTIEAHYRRLPAYRLVNLHNLDYRWPLALDTRAGMLITSDACWRRYVKPDGPDTPRRGDPLYSRFARNREFYALLLAGKTPYRLVQTFDSGQGAAVRVFARTKSAQAVR